MPGMPGIDERNYLPDFDVKYTEQISIIMKTIKTGWIVLLLISSMATAQSTQESKESKKLQRQAEAQMRLAKIDSLIEEKRLVLEANTLKGKSGSTVSVGANNFILIDSNNFVLQTSYAGGVGANGLGGVTAKGQVMSYKVSRNKKKNAITVYAQVNTLGVGQGSLTIQVNNSPNASAIFVNNSGNVIEFFGPIKSLEESRVYEGIRQIEN